MWCLPRSCFFLSYDISAHLSCLSLHFACCLYMYVWSQWRRTSVWVTTPRATLSTRAYLTIPPLTNPCLSLPVFTSPCQNLPAPVLSPCECLPALVISCHRQASLLPINCLSILVGGLSYLWSPHAACSGGVHCSCLSPASNISTGNTQHSISVHIFRAPIYQKIAYSIKFDSSPLFSIEMASDLH